MNTDIPWSRIGFSEGVNSYLSVAVQGAVDVSILALPALVLIGVLIVCKLVYPTSAR